MNPSMILYQISSMISTEKEKKAENETQIKYRQ